MRTSAGRLLDAEYGPDAVKQLQKTMPEPWRSKVVLTVQEIFTWVMLRRAMQSAGDNARKEVFDRIEGRPTIKVTGGRADQSRRSLTT
jgi:hypothetical protein